MMRSLNLKKLFHVKPPTVLISTGILYAYPQNVRCYSAGTVVPTTGGGRRYVIKSVKTVEATAAATHKVGDQSDKSRGSDVAPCSEGPSEVQNPIGNSPDCSRLGHTESGSGSGLGNEGLKSNPTSDSSKNSSRALKNLLHGFNTIVTSMLSSSGGDPSIIDTFVKEWLPGCTVKEVSNFMRITGKKSRDKSYLHLKRHLPTIASRIENLSSQSWAPLDVAAALYGLQCLREDDDGYLTIVAAMTAALSKSIQDGQAASPQELSMMMVGLQKNKLKSHQSLGLISSVTMAIKSCKVPLSTQAVGNALYGVQSMSSDHAEVRSMISALSGKVHSCKEPLSGQEMGNALYGMQRMSSDHAEVRSMILALSDKVHSCKESLDAQGVGNALYGMQRMSSDRVEVRKMILALSDKVNSCKVPLSTQAVGNALYGMQRMSSDHAEVRSMISALSGKVLNCKESLDAQNVSNALYGMQNMSSNHAEVRSMISALSGKVNSCKEPLSAHAVGGALYGMQNMSSDHAEVRSIISALSGKVLGCRAPFDAHAVGNVLHGMQNMSSDHAEVRSMISALSGKVNSCKEPLSAQAVGNVLYGMQRMSSDHAEVRSMISVLSDKVHSCKESLDARAVGDALYGMQSMSCDTSIAIHALLLRHALASLKAENLSKLDLLSIGQAVLLCIPSRRAVLDDASYNLWTDYGDSVCTERRRRITSDKRVDSARSELIGKMHNACSRVLGQFRAKLSSKEYLFDIFWSHVVARIPIGGSTDGAEASDDSKFVMINIEVNNMHHIQQKKINFCKLRDAYFKSRGVVVHRIDASLLNKMDIKEVDQWVTDAIALSQYNGLLSNRSNPA